MPANQILRTKLALSLSLLITASLANAQSGSRAVSEPGLAPIISANRLPTESTVIQSPMTDAAFPSGSTIPTETPATSSPMDSTLPMGMSAGSSEWKACTCPACSGDPNAESCTMLSEAASCTAPGGDGCCGCGAGCGCGLGLLGCKCGKEEAKPAAPKKDDKPTCKGSHKGVFYANDFKYLSNPKYDGFCLGDNLKQIKLNGCGCGSPNCYDPCCGAGGAPSGPVLDIGGQLRLRYHHERGMGQEAGFTRFQNTENDFGLLRLRLYSNLKLTDNIRVFAEGIYADVVGANDEYVPRGIDRNRGDLNNLFVDLKLTDRTSVRLGRQEILLGAQRLVSPLDWANTRQRFDGIRMTNKGDKFTLDSFYTNFVPFSVDEFDDFFQDNIKFWGTYGTYKGKDDTLDLYYLGLDNDAADFNIHTFGARMLGGRENWLYEVEGAAQLGDQDGLGLAHEAAFATVGVGRKFPKGVWTPTVWFYYDYASGNNIGGDFNAFNQLFPLGHKYLGFVDAVARSNIESPNILLTMNPGPKTKLLLWYYHFIANQEGSPVPSLGGTPAQSTVSSNLGNEIDVLLTHAISPRSTLVLGYSRFFRGNRILADTDADFAYAQWHINF